VDSLTITEFLNRPRIDRIFEQATMCKLVYVIAGAGYGKTQAVRQYIDEQPDAVVRWVQLTESDNIVSNFWEHLARNVSFDNLELAARLREFGFPDSASRFKQFTQILNESEHRSDKIFLVLDDFHLMHSKHALDFAERCAHLQLPGSCVIIISRSEPQINTMSLFAKGKACIVTEDELRFNEDEIAAFLTLRGIPYAASTLTKLWNATEGWALALQLLSLVLKRTPDNPDFALETMKQNVYKLFETEAFNDFSKDVQKEGINTQFFRRADELCQHVLDSAPDAEKLDMPRITEQQRVVCLVVFVLLIVPAVYVLAVMLAGYLRQHQ